MYLAYSPSSEAWGLCIGYVMTGRVTMTGRVEYNGGDLQQARQWRSWPTDLRTTGYSAIRSKYIEHHESSLNWPHQVISWNTSYHGAVEGSRWSSVLAPSARNWRQFERRRWYLDRSSSSGSHTKSGGSYRRSGTPVRTRRCWSMLGCPSGWPTIPPVGSSMGCPAGNSRMLSDGFWKADKRRTPTSRLNFNR